MKMNPEYIRSLLMSIESIESPTPTTTEIINNFVGTTDKLDENLDFLLHYDLLHDYGFIEPIGSSNGIEATMGNLAITSSPQRITAKGHEFLSNLEKPDVWEIIKRDFKQESLDTILKVSKELAAGFAKEKLGKYLK